MVLGDIVKRNAKRYPQKTALVFKDKRYTFWEFNNRVNSLANALLDMGVRKGDRVAVLADNCHQYVELYCAVPKGGMVLVPLNTGLSEPELTYIINDAGANTLFLGENYLGKVDSIRGSLKEVKHLISIGAPSGEMRGYEEIVSRYPSDEPKAEVKEDDMAYLLYTSGTTGLPKGVHRSIIEGAMNFLLAYQLISSDVALLMVPPHWSAFLLVILIPHFYLGCSIVLLQEPAPERVLETIEKEKTTTGLMILPHIFSLLECPESSKYDICSMRAIMVGGAPTPVEIWKRAISIFGNIFIHSYGLTELPQLSSLPIEDVVLEGSEREVRRLRSCGREVTNVEMRVVDGEGRDVSPGQVGEIIAKGDSMMKGYWNLPQATVEALRGGYLYTGDMATIDEKGYLYLTGKKKEVIVSGGRSIYPPEVEEVLYRHPAISEAAVVGVSDEESGESVKAFVVLKGEAKATQEEIIDFCKQRLASYATPKWVEFVDSLPRNPSGKVLRGVLKERH